MDPKLYYTKEELMAIPHFNFVETDTNLYMHQKDGEFEIYKKLYLLQKDSPELKEIYVTINQYIVIREYLSGSLSRYMKEFDGYIFFSVKDYIEQLNEANKNKMF